MNPVVLHPSHLGCCWNWFSGCLFFIRLEENSDATLQSCPHHHLSCCYHPVSHFPAIIETRWLIHHNKCPSSFEIYVAFTWSLLCENYVPQRKSLSGSRVVPWRFEHFSLFKWTQLEIQVVLLHGALAWLPQRHKISVCKLIMPWLLVKLVVNHFKAVNSC